MIVYSYVVAGQLLFILKYTYIYIYVLPPSFVRISEPKKLFDDLRKKKIRQKCIATFRKIAARGNTGNTGSLLSPPIFCPVYLTYTPFGDHPRVVRYLRDRGPNAVTGCLIVGPW